MPHVFGEPEKPQFAVSQTSKILKALILDDNMFDLHRIRRLAQDTRLAIDLDEVASIDALETMLDEDSFDVIFLGYRLPKGDGLDALKLIRRHAVNGRCATIMVTGNDQTDVAVKSLQMGCIDYIAKDKLDALALRDLIVKAIEKETRDRPANASDKADLENLAAAMMREYTEVLQPKLANIIRDMRALRLTLGRSNDVTQEEIQKVERQCVQMWAILLDPKTKPARKEVRH